MSESGQRAEPPGDNLPEPSASGLREDQIAPEDLAAISALFKPATIIPTVGLQTATLSVSAQIEVGGLGVQNIEPDMAPAVGQQLRVAKLPGKATLRKLKVRRMRARFCKDAAVAMRVPIMRERISPLDLTLVESASLKQALLDKFGSEASGMLIEAVFPHVPPEAARSVRVEPALERIRFSWPAALKPGKARAGFFLIILRDPQGNRHQLLLRL